MKRSTNEYVDHRPYFGGVGPRRTGCISCGKCYIGCGHNAKNKLTTNYLYLAEKLGAEVHQLHEVYDLVPYTAEQVIVAAHAYGSAKLLLHMQHEGRLTGLSSEVPGLAPSSTLRDLSPLGL